MEQQSKLKIQVFFFSYIAVYKTQIGGEQEWYHFLKPKFAKSQIYQTVFPSLPIVGRSSKRYWGKGYKLSITTDITSARLLYSYATNERWETCIKTFLNDVT